MKKYLPSAGSILGIILITAVFVMMYGVHYPDTMPFANLVNSNPWFPPIALLFFMGVGPTFVILLVNYENWRNKN